MESKNIKPPQSMMIPQYYKKKGHCTYIELYGHFNNLLTEVFLLNYRNSHQFQMMSDLHQKNVVIVQNCAFSFVVLTATKAL